MASRQLAQTLPRNFTFHISDLPCTPPPPANDLDVAPFDVQEPPQVRHKYLIRRRRRPQHPPPTPLAPAAHYKRPLHDDDAEVPIPTIEVSDTHANTRPPTLPDLAFRIPFSPPKTPLDKLIGDEEQIIEASRAWEYDWELRRDDAQACPTLSSRPSTSYSRGTNSSFSSSVASYPSDATMATSPDLVSLDDSEMHLRSSPLDTKGFPPPISHLRTRINPAWSGDMDAHLWHTYLRYLQDPTHTPFKMLPGTAPPIGVCERVAREARRSWKSASPSVTSRPPVSLGDRIQLGSKRRLSASPEPRKFRSPWPRSEAAVRRRLKELCKGEPMLAPHYARLMYRTPSPFRSSSQAATSPPPAPNRNIVPSPSHATSQADFPSLAEAVHAITVLPVVQASAPADQPTDKLPVQSPGDSTFSTRAMNLSLATSTSSTMHPGGFFSQLAGNPITPQIVRRASDDVTTPIHRKPPLHDILEDNGARIRPLPAAPLPPLNIPSRPSSAAKETRPNRSTFSVHQKSQSLHHNFFGRGALFGSSGTLASPFAPRPPMPRAETVRDFKRPTLESPIQLVQPIPKRRKECDSILKMAMRDEDPFIGPSRKHSEPCVPLIESVRPNYRLRGFTVGAFVQNARNNKQRRPSLYAQFPPPQFALAAEEDADIISGVGLAPPLPTFPPRLASPFKPEQHAYTFPRNRPVNPPDDAVMVDAPAGTPHNPNPARRGLEGLFR